MMRAKVKILLLLSALSAVLFYACSKYKDPPPAQHDDRLDRHYCNDSKAVNFNWDFPGIPDNAVCVYPVDSFLGSWVLTDTIYLPNGEISGTQIKNLVFGATEDTVLTHLSVTGWCSNSAAFYITANKYRKAQIDTLLQDSPGQYLCTNSDTLSGLILNSSTDTLKFDLAITNAGGTTYHKGTAVRP